jgi:hypothetical protein
VTTQAERIVALVTAWDVDDLEMVHTLLSEVRGAAQ